MEILLLIFSEYTNFQDRRNDIATQFVYIVCGNNFVKIFRDEYTNFLWE